MTPAKNNPWVSSNECFLPESLISLKHTQPIDNIADMNSSEIVVGLKTLQMYILGSYSEKLKLGMLDLVRLSGWRPLALCFRREICRLLQPTGTWSFLNATCISKNNDLSITCSKYSQSGRRHGQHCNVRTTIYQPCRRIC